uniref:Uncharacterized protein n=1 Tax=Papilio xuthus TaxID=66420 RepID=I4DLM0_PAPXU|nr:unknown unsecreted protein [Papilio xuthus]
MRLDFIALFYCTFMLNYCLHQCKISVNTQIQAKRQTLLVNYTPLAYLLVIKQSITR